MSEWNSKQYLKFEAQRSQPAKDLALHISENRFKTIADIGCGPGNSTAILKQMFPTADICGIDSSENMIAAAKELYPAINFSVCDALSINGKYDLLFSNACLQWIPDHEKVIPALMAKLNRNGMLAVQMPANSQEPLYKIIDESVIALGLNNTVSETNVTLSADEYIGILSKITSDFEVWETKYHHILPDCNAMIEWVKGTKLRPFLNTMDDKSKKEFEETILNKAKSIYKPLPSGEVIFGFKRLFFTARK